MCRKVNKLYENDAIEEFSELDRLRVEKIVYMIIEVTGNNEIVRNFVGAGKKRRELIMKDGEWL